MGTKEQGTEEQGISNEEVKEKPKTFSNTHVSLT
jgi:hypothetical protein